MRGYSLKLENQKFGKLTVLSYAGTKNTNSCWLCECDCGTQKIIQGQCLLRGTARSCGCLRKELLLVHGMTGSPEYCSWQGAKTRCNNPTHEKFIDYGGRGIKICNRWANSFKNFFEDMGKKPSSKHTLDRIDNNGNYQPGNCRWATAKQQNNNQRRKRIEQFSNKEIRTEYNKRFKQKPLKS